MNSLVKNIFKNTIIYALVFSMIFSSFITGSSTSILNSLIEAQANNFVHGSPKDASCGVCSEAYRYPPFEISIYRNEKAQLEGTDGFTTFFDSLAAGIPERESLFGSYVVWCRIDERYPGRISQSNTRYMVYTQGQDYGVNKLGSGEAIGGYLNILESGSYNYLQSNGVYFDKINGIDADSLSADVVNMVTGGGNYAGEAAAAKRAFGAMLYYNTGTETIFDIEKAFSSIFGMYGADGGALDYGNYNEWSDEQRTEAWYRYLDFLICCAVNSGSAQSEWIKAINDYISGDITGENALAVVIQPGTFGVWRADGTTWTEFMTAYDFLGTTCSMLNQDMMNSSAWWDLGSGSLDVDPSVHGNFYSMFEKGYRNTFANYSNNLRHERTLNKSGSDLYSWAIGAIVKERLKLPYDGSIIYDTSNGTPDGYISNATFTDGTRVLEGFSIYPAPGGGPRVSLGILKATPDNYPIKTDIVPRHVDLTLYGSATEEQMETWLPLIEHADAKGYSFTVKVEWESDADKYGLTSNIISNPTEQTWDARTFEEWLKNNRAIRAYDAIQGQQFVTEETILFIEYKANITISVQTAQGLLEETGYCFDPASFIYILDGISYTSEPEGYTEFKNFGVNSDFTGNLSEDFEVMAGVPSTEQLYFAAGGSEFIVDITLNEVNNETAYRTYDFYYNSVPCENKDGDQANETWTMPSPTGKGLNSSDVTFNIHGEDIMVSASWSGTVRNDAVASKSETKTGKHSVSASVSIPGINNASDVADYNAAIQERNAWIAKVKQEIIKHTAVSDDFLRETTIGAICTVDSTNELIDAADASDEQSNSAACPDTKNCKCSNLSVTASCTKGADGSWSVSATITVPAHAICGPCCKHDITEIHDTWKTSFNYDSMEINNIHIWRLDQGAIEGLEDIINVDVVGADIVTEAPTVWYNIALKNDPNYKKLAYGEGYGGATATNHADVGRVWYHTYREEMDSVTISLGTRDNFCDGTSKTDVGNIKPSGGNGHAEVWGKKGFTYEYSVNSWVATPLIGSQHKGEIDSTLNPGGDIQYDSAAKAYVQVEGTHELLEKTDQYDKVTKEYYGFLGERDRVSGVTMVTDYLILQTSGGDQSVMYYEQSASSMIDQDSVYNPIDLGDLNPNYAHGEIGGDIADVMWYNNPLSAAKWAPDEIYVGSYNGNYFRNPENKYGIPETYGEVKTAFDGGYIEADMLMQERPKRPEHKTMIYEGDLNIILSNQNDAYYTGYSEVYWSNQLHWANIEYQRANRHNDIVKIYANEYTKEGMFNTLALLSTTTFQFKEMPNTGYVYDSGATLKNEAEVYTDIVSEDYGVELETDEKNLGLSGHQFGIEDYQVHGGYVQTGVYSPTHNKCNDIIIYNPVSTQDTQLISLPNYRDQRTEESISGGANDLIEAIAKNQICPEEPALCDYRTLNCKFLEDQVVFRADFDTQIDDKFVNLVSKKVNKKNDTVTYDEFTVPPGMRIENLNALSNSKVLSAFATRLSIPFTKLDITYQPSIVLKVEADILIEPSGEDKMIFSFNGYGLYLPAKDENGQDSNRFVYFTTGNGLERKVKVPLADGEKHKLTVEFSMHSLDYCKVWIDGEEVELLTINESNTLSSSLIGGHFNIGCWNKDNDYSAAFYLDNLVITRKAGTAEHNETCYTVDVTHGNALNNHRHTALCLSLEDNSYNVDKTFEYTGDVQVFTIPADGYYQIEAWGAQGGGASWNQGSHGGLGGKTTGTAYFQKGEKLYIYVGGQGEYVSSGQFGGAGYNGGGFGASNGYGGGGMTHVSTTQNPAMNKRDEIIVSEKGEQEFTYTGTVQQFTAPATGNYTFELYGAQGGSDGGAGTGGLGGKTTGIVSLPKGMTVYIVVGGKGADSATGTGGGYNGGGNAGSVGSSGAGGGATHIAFADGLLRSLYDRSGYVLMVAGGGGGGGNSYAGTNGGAGGGESHNAPEGSYGADYMFGRGQDRDETGGNKDGAGGGGGWYGGYASYGDGGGAGGTGYIDDSILNGATESGVNEGNGKVVVSWDIYIDNSNYSEQWNPKGTLIVAGGGGGADNAGGTIGGGDDGSGGHGGGLTAQGAFIDGVLQSSVATQSSGYAQGIGESATVLTDTGGAGGGWYGGYATNHYNGGAGGGSSYVYGYTGTNRTEITDLSIGSNGERQFKNVQVAMGVNQGNGKVRITKVGSIMEQVLESMNGSYGIFTESELKDYFGDAYEYLKKEDPLTVLKSYSDFKESSNGFYSLLKGSKPDVVAMDDGSIRIGGTSGYEAALSTDIEAGSLRYIEVIYAAGSNANSASVQLNKERTFTATGTTNENGDKVCLINVEDYAQGMHITDIYFDLGSSGYSTVKQINFLGYGVTSTEIREYDVASGGLIEDTVKLWANPFGASVYRITLVGAGGGDARIVNTATVVKDSGGAGAYLTGKSPISAGAEIAITVGGRGQDQASTASVSQGNKVTFNYSGTEQVYTAPVDGRYYIEAYGASGGGSVIGSGASHGGKGGMTSGFVDLTAGEKLYVYVGGQGQLSTGYGTGGGYNGGGHAGPGGYGGGGMTHISTTQNPATASIEVTSEPAEPSYFEGSVTVNGVGTYKVMDFVSPVTGTMDIKFYCSNGHLTGYYVMDSLGNKVDTGNVHKGTYSEAEVWMYNVSLVQGSTYGLYLYSECSNFADPDTSKADRSQVVTASFSTQGGITEFYEAKGDWNPDGTIMVAAGGGGADNGGGTVNGADDGSGGYGGGTSGEAAKADGAYVKTANTVYATNSVGSWNLQAGATTSGSTFVLPSGAGVHVHTGMSGLPGNNNGDVWKVTYNGTNLNNLDMRATSLINGVWTNGGYTITNVEKSDTKTVFTVKSTTNATSLAFCTYNKSGSQATYTSIDVENINIASGAAGTQTSGFKQGVGQSAEKSCTGYGDVGGAGAGWYGGYTTNHGNGGGAGGSSYYASSVIYGDTQANKREGNGVVTITEPLESRPDNADGTGGYNGGGDGGIEFNEGSPESSAGGGGMTDMKVDGNFFAIAAGGGGAGSHIGSNYNGIATKSAYGKTWARVLYQDISNNTNYFTTATMGSVDQEGLYSCLNRLEDFRGEDGKFEFMLEYPDSVYYSGTPNIWKQSSNPYTQQKTNGNNTGADATGFEAISYPMASSSYGGGLEYNGGSCVLDGAVNHGNWWLCVGIMNSSYSPTNGDHGRQYTMPGPVGGSGSEGVSKVALWVRIDNTNVNIASLKDTHFGGDAGTVLTDGQATNGYTEAGTQESGYRLPDVLEPDNIGFGQNGQNGVRSKNYGTVGGGGAGWYGGAQPLEYKGTEALGGAGGSSYLSSEWSEFESYSTNHGDGSFDLNEFRETLIIKKGTYDSEITTEVIMKYYTLIPDFLPDGRYNPLWAHCQGENNIHVCDETCGEIKILTCTEPHHDGNHYGPYNEVCWEACMNDANHKTVGSSVTADGTFDGGNFINLDYGFEIFFPNRSLLNDQEPYGIGALATEKGKGFTDIYEANENFEYFKSQYINVGCCSPLNGLAEVTENPYLRGVVPQIEPSTGRNYIGTAVGTNTTKWTRVKRIKFDVDVVYDPTPTGTNEYSENAQLYLAGEWITLGDRGTYKGALGGIGHELDEGKYDPTAWTNYGTYLYEGIYRDRYQFYCVMENSEQKAASYTVEVTALNAIDFDSEGYGQKNDNTEITNSKRFSGFTAKHGGININYYDVVGRIGNLVLEDTEDFRFSNLFKQTVEQMDSTSTIQTDMFYVGKGLGLEDTEGLDNKAVIREDYVVTGSTGAYAAVKGYNATQNFYKVEVVGKSLTAGRLAVINTADEYKELSDDKFTNIQYSAEKISYYIDMTGFTDTTTVVDFKYVAKATNTMVVSSITVSKLGKSPDGWILDGIVQEVDPTKQKTVFDWVADIRGITLSGATRQQNTWGAIPWIESVGHLDLPLSPDKNNIEILKAEPMLVGYNGLFDIQTLGNYWQNGCELQIIPKYWAIENSTGKVIPLDVYMQHDGVYEPINIHGNVDKTNSDKPILNEIYNDIVNLDWENEHERRNYYGREEDEEGDVLIDGTMQHYKIVVPDRAFCVEDLGITWEAADDYLDTNDPNVTEHYRTLAVWIETLPSREILEEQMKDSELGQEGSTVSIAELLANKEPLNMPGGHINTLGNRQYLSLDGNARTFIGGIATYDKLQDLGGRIMDYLWYRQAQRWYFTIGLPSASVFVEHGNEVSVAEIKRIQEGGYTVICSLDITAKGSVWYLQYKHRWDGSGAQGVYPYYDNGGGDPEMGEVSLIGTNADGKQVSLGKFDLNKIAAAVDYDPIIFVYNPALDSGQDVEIVGTH